VREMGAEFAEDKPAIRLPFSVGRYGLRITGNGPPGSLCVPAVNKYCPGFGDEPKNVSVRARGGAGCRAYRSVVMRLRNLCP